MVPLVRDCGDEEAGGNPVALYGAPAAVSMIAHLMLLIILGLIVNEPPPRVGDLGLFASRDVETPNFENLPVQEVDRDVPLGMQMEFTAANVEAAAAPEAPIGPVEVDVQPADLTPGMTASTVGTRGAAFFGAVAKGKKFVFVVDNSNSMNGRAGSYTKFQRAKAELLESISKLSRDKSYYIVFFNADAVRMFDPSPPPTFVQATKENYDKLYDWLVPLGTAKGTRGKAAMQIAIDLKPDAIYVLGDGAFTDDTADVLASMNRFRVPIHTLLFGGKGASKGQESMKRIASENKGSYTTVD
jgi:hypothetical protein